MSNEDNKPITTGALIKWGGIVILAGTSIVSIVWFAASLKSDIITLQQQAIAEKAKQELKNEQFTKDIDTGKIRQDASDKAVVDINRKLDVATTILERIDKKVGSN